jgi:serine phosphatase RsbU (regulator of sigma subunit)
MERFQAQGISPVTVPAPGQAAAPVPAAAPAAAEEWHAIEDPAQYLGPTSRFSDQNGPVHRILLVEDDSGDALIVRELLADTDLRFVLCWKATLAEALVELSDQPADCVLLDLNLPDGLGPSLVSSVQSACPEAAVIVLTGLSDSHSGIQAVANGAQDYLLKGQIDAPLLHRSIRYSVHRKQNEHANAELLKNQMRAQENSRLERGLLPVPLLRSPGFAAATRYLPAREGGLLGGDFLDVVQTDENTVHAVIGDVSGHGPDEAAMGVSLRIAWRALVLAGQRGPRLLELLDQLLIAEGPYVGMFATCSIVTLALAERRATIHLAGHHGPLLTEQGRVEQVRAKHGVALGIANGRGDWPETELVLPPSGALLLYTDGLVEGYSGRDNSRLGEDGLVKLISGVPGLTAEPLLDHLVEVTRRLNAERHADDLAILHLAWNDGRGGADGR